MGRRSGIDDPASSGGMTEHLNALLSPPTAGPAPIQDLTSVLHGPAEHFQLDLDQAPKAITAFRQVAEQLRDLMEDVRGLANIRPPGLDTVSINAAKVIGQWASSGGPGSLSASLESGAMQLEKTADTLERSLAVHRSTDEANAAQLNRRQL
jgi:hypothetical protein